jgi:hypothetical protein
MVGVILFCLILLFYGFILSLPLLEKTFPQSKAIFAKFNDFLDKGATKIILALAGIIIGVWNLFAPNFAAIYAPPIIGALIPSLLMIVDSTIIYPNVLEILNIPQEQKDKYYGFVEKYKSIAGIVTIISGFLHMALYNKILF